MLDKPQTESQTSEVQFPFKIVDAGGAALFTKLNELMVKTTRAIWESETELLRLETEQVTKCFTPARIGEDPATTITDLTDQLQQRTDSMITQMRRINDLTRECGWQLIALYAEGLQQAAKSASPRSPD